MWRRRVNCRASCGCGAWVGRWWWIFAPVPKKDRGTLDQVLKAAFRSEGAETHLAGWTALGLYELTRKRDRLPLAELLGDMG